MSKRNGTVEETIESVPEKDAGALPLIERRIAELERQREQAAEQARMNDAAYIGAIQSMEQLRSELLEQKNEEQPAKPEEDPVAEE